MGQLYSAGDWLVKEGREDEFVEAWEDFATWSAENTRGAVWALLARNVENPRRFTSFGPWEDADAIAAWRASDGFQERIGRIRELLEAFEPQTLEAVAEVS